MAVIPAGHTFVGRSDELHRLHAALTRAANGRGSVLFLAGETGIGKTRLGKEGLALAGERGFQLLEGRAYPVESGLAYALVLDAVGAFLRGLDRSRLSILVSGLPDLGRLFSDLSLPAPEALGDPAMEKTRLFEAMARFLDRLSRQTPVCLFLDDLHWADPASLELLHYLARGLADQPVLLLASYNPHEAHSARGLRALIRSLQRIGLAEELTIAGLAKEDQVELIHSILGGDGPPELVALLQARAAGTPLFIEAMTHALMYAGQLAHKEAGWSFDSRTGFAVPSGVRELILERLDRLAESDRHILDLIAVCGDAVPHAILRAASGLEEDNLLVVLQRLRVAGIVAEQADGVDVAYRVSHPLMQEVAYAELSEMGRRHTHAAVAAAVEQLRPDDLGHLARHYRGAGPEGNQDRALDVLLEAGRRALTMYANDEAAQHFLAALTLVREGRRTELRPWLLEQLGEAWSRVGEVGAAIALWAEALDDHQRAHDSHAVARLHRRLAAAEWGRGHAEDAQAHLVAGLDVLANAEPCLELVELLRTQVTIFSRLGAADRLAAVAEELQRVAKHWALPQAEAEAQLVQVYLATVRGDYAVACQRALAALTPIERTDDHLLARRIHEAVFIPALCLGSHRLARWHAEQALDLARQLGAPTLELAPRLALGLADLLAGAWDEALHRSIETTALARRIDRPRGLAEALGTRAAVLAWRGDLATAETFITEARAANARGLEAVDDPSGYINLACALGDAALAVDPSDPIRVYLMAWAATPLTQWNTLPAVLLAAVGEAQAVVGQVDSALDTAHRLASLASERPCYAGAVAARIEGLARRILGESEDAMFCLARAAEEFGALEMPFEAARARLEWATLAAAVDVDSAGAAAQESLIVFNRLGARHYADQTRRILRQLGIRANPSHRPHPSDGRLSERELQVARLVAEGLTNAQIAERLVLSRRTVTTHLERIYARLKLDSRQALARYVTQANLPDQADRIT